MMQLLKMRILSSGCQSSQSCFLHNIRETLEVFLMFIQFNWIFHKNSSPHVVNVENIHWDWKFSHIFYIFLTHNCLFLFMQNFLKYQKIATIHPLNPNWYKVIER